MLRLNMLTSALQNPVVWTTGLTALAALGAFLYNVWQDHRRLKICFTPLRRGHVYPVDSERRKSRVVFTVRVTARNPGKTTNKLESMTAWRDGQVVRCCWPPLDSGSIPVSIPAFETVTPEIQIFAFEATEDVKRAYESIKKIGIEVRALRGRRRVTFDRDAFPLPE